MGRTLGRNVNDRRSFLSTRKITIRGLSHAGTNGISGNVHGKAAKYDERSQPTSKS
jgi:hypothetical protein